MVGASFGGMNPDVIITIVFVGLAVLGALGALWFVAPQIRREQEQAARRTSNPPDVESPATAPKRHASVR